jgi:hypothetical protein
LVAKCRDVGHSINIMSIALPRLSEQARSLLITDKK